MASTIYALALIWVAFTFSDSLAINCFYRSGDHTVSVSNLSCPSSSHCYLRSSEYYRTLAGFVSDLFAGCTSDSGLCSEGYEYCVLCSTDFCNNMTSPRNCYFRSSSTSPSTSSFNFNFTNNGTAISCPGYAYCYSDTSYNSFPRYELKAGCTSVRSGSNSFYTCSSDYCNSRSPSSLSCVLFYGSLEYSGAEINRSNNSLTCASGITSCYMFSSGQVLKGSCGSCNTNKGTCRMCSTNNCNTILPSSIKCYYRAKILVPYTGPGSVIDCHTGITTCRSHTDGWGTFADCGGCESAAFGSCVTCSSNLCNIHLPSSISCYHRQRMFSGFVSDGSLTQCSAGVSTCFIYRNVSQYPLYYAYEESAGCGMCNASAPNTISCSVCGSSGCNSVLSATVTTLANTNTPSFNAVNTSNTGITTTQQASCQKKCYYSFGEQDYGKRTRVTCSSCSCFEFSLGSGTTNFFYAGCGNCSTMGGFFTNCRTCYTDYCNSTWSLSAGQASLYTVANVCGLILLLMSRVSV